MTAPLTDPAPAPGAARPPRLGRRLGAVEGVLLAMLGAWGALIPFIGPYFHLSYTPDSAWHWTMARFWLEVLPGAVAFLAGLAVIGGASRALVALSAWAAAVAGVWFVVGRDLASWWHLGSPGVPAHRAAWVRAIESLVMFSALGAVLLILGTVALVRSSARRVLADGELPTARSARVGTRGQVYDRGRHNEPVDGSFGTPVQTRELPATAEVGEPLASPTRTRAVEE